MQATLVSVSIIQRTLRVSGSENAPGPLKTSLQLSLLVPMPLDQRKSQLRLMSTPRHARPAWFARFLRHIGTPPGTRQKLRPSGLTIGSMKMSSPFTTSCTSAAV